MANIFFVGTFQSADEKKIMAYFNTCDFISKKTGQISVLYFGVKGRAKTNDLFNFAISVPIFVQSSLISENPLQKIQSAISKFSVLGIMAFDGLNPNPFQLKKASAAKSILTTSFLFSPAFSNRFSVK